MLKKIVIMCVIAATVSIFYIVIANIKNKFNPDFEIGVVKTNTSQPRSKIDFYDSDLNVVEEKSFFFGGLCCGGSAIIPKVNDKIYLLSHGTDFIPSKNILELNLNSGVINKYKANDNYSSHIAVNDKYIFTIFNALKPIISRYDIVNKKMKEIELPNKGPLSSLYVFDNKLYAFAVEFESKKSHIYIMDIDSMKTLKTIDISVHGSTQSHCMQVDNDLYFSNSYRFDSEAGHEITKLNLVTNELTSIKLTEESPYQILQKNKDELIISHLHSKKLTVYNLATHEQKVVSLKGELKYAAANKDKLYVIDTNDMLYRYDLKTFELEIEKEAMTKNEHLYPSAIFVKS